MSEDSTTQNRPTECSAASRPKCCLTEAGLECIGNGHTGCGWHGCEEAATNKRCRYTWDDRIGITGYMLDKNGDDDVWLCPKCGGECAHTPLNECVFDGVARCECRQNADIRRAQTDSQQPAP